ncbi:MAG: flagellar hook-associated protein FlgK [Gemmatimonadota bacterium]
MSSGLFSIARSALTTHQIGLQTVAQNIANAETEGYSRQEALNVANTPVRMSYGNVGTGVSVATIIRKRDILLDDGFRTANASLGSAETRRDVMSSIENIFGEPTDAGMSNALDQFWGSWSDLATSPSSDAARSVVQQRGAQVAGLFNSYDTALSQQRVSTLDSLANTVARINQLAEQTAELNGRIVSSEIGGDTANDLRDQRDLVLDELSKLAGTRVFPQANGAVSVIIGNSSLVDGTSARPVTMELLPPVPPPAVVPSDIPVRIRLGNSEDALYPLGGELSALVKVVNTDIPALRDRLDTMASALVTAVNDAHTAGYTFPGGTIPGTAAGVFFDAGSATDPVRGGTIRLHSLIATDASKIAASGNASAPTDNGAATVLAGLRAAGGTVSYTDANGASESGSFLSFFRNSVTRLGIDVRRAEDDVTVYSALRDQADARRQSVSGVNTDEELVQMLKLQQSYTAATKLIKTADEMLQTLLSLI